MWHVQTMFQSLSGFFRPCNSADGLTITLAEAVSIPVGFFQALQPPIKITLDAPLTVSIPVGFFQALQHDHGGIRRPGHHRVSIPVGFFQALQPSFSKVSLSAGTVFQSLSGFFRPCNGLM